MKVVSLNQYKQQKLLEEAEHMLLCAFIYIDDELITDDAVRRMAALIFLEQLMSHELKDNEFIKEYTKVYQKWVDGLLEPVEKSK